MADPGLKLRGEGGGEEAGGGGFCLPCRRSFLCDFFSFTQNKGGPSPWAAPLDPLTRKMGFPRVLSLHSPKRTVDRQSAPLFTAPRKSSRIRFL